MRKQTLFAAALLCATCVASFPTFGITMAGQKFVPGGPTDTVPHGGTVTAPPTGGTIVIDGTTYLFNPVLVKPQGASGKNSPAPPLRKGSNVKFKIGQDGRQVRITELWVLSK